MTYAACCRQMATLETSMVGALLLCPWWAGQRGWLASPPHRGWSERTSDAEPPPPQPPAAAGFDVAQSTRCTTVRVGNRGELLPIPRLWY